MGKPSISKARFSVGDVIHHRLFGYRGVIYDLDPGFQGTEEWYDSMAMSRPPRDRPWYHVLVDGATHATYVAERNLEQDPMGGAVHHPLLDEFFTRFDGQRYIREHRDN